MIYECVVDCACCILLSVRYGKLQENLKREKKNKTRCVSVSVNSINIDYTVKCTVFFFFIKGKEKPK